MSPRVKGWLQYLAGVACGVAVFFLVHSAAIEAAGEFALRYPPERRALAVSAFALVVSTGVVAGVLAVIAARFVLPERRRDQD